MHCRPPALGKHGTSLKFPTSPPPSSSPGPGCCFFAFTLTHTLCYAQKCCHAVVGLCSEDCGDRRTWSLRYQSICEMTYCVNSRNNLLAAGGSSSWCNQQLVWASTSCETLLMISCWCSVVFGMMSVCMLQPVITEHEGQDPKCCIFSWYDLLFCLFNHNAILTQLKQIWDILQQIQCTTG